MSRFRVLQPHLEQNTSLRIVAAEAGLAFRTAQRWVAQYRASGLSALVRKARGDRGARRIVSKTIKTAIEGLALESHPIPVTSVHRQIKEFAEAIGDTAPGYWTV
jgi:putative transposase